MAEASPPDRRDWIGIVAQQLSKPAASEGDFAEFLEPVDSETEKDSYEC